MRGPPTVLVLRALGLGDLLTAVPALRGLRQSYPGRRIVLAAPAALAELATLIDAVDVVWPTAGLETLRWRQEPCEVAVNLHGSGPESIRALASGTDCPVLTHAHPRFPDIDGPQWRKDQHEVGRWCRMLEHFGIVADPVRTDLARPERPSPRPGAAIVHPGASHRARQWPVERFARLAWWLDQHGHEVVVTGSAAEIPLAEQVASDAGLPTQRVLAGRTGLVELAALVADAGLVVCPDTGMAHLATAYSVPSVVLFGPVAPRHWGPPDDPHHAALWAGSVGDTFADTPDAGLLRLSSDTVIEAAQRVLAAQPSRASVLHGGGGP